VVSSSSNGTSRALQSAANSQNGCRSTKAYTNKKLCFACHSDQHVVANCPSNTQKRSSATSAQASAHDCAVDTVAGRLSTQDHQSDTPKAECSACDVNCEFQAGFSSKTGAADFVQYELNATNKAVDNFVSTLTSNDVTDIQLSPLNYIVVV
jgi:hypothetical protein